MKTARRILAIGTALMMIFGCLTAYAADETTPQKISTDTVLEVDGNIIITDYTDEFALEIDGNSSGEIKAEVSVSESIAAGETSAGGSYTGAVDIETGYGSTADVSAGRDITATSASDGVQVTGIGISAGEASAVTVEAGNGDLIVTTDGDDAPAKGMEIRTEHTSSADVNVGTEGGGGITAETTGVNSMAAGAQLYPEMESSIGVKVGDGGIYASAAQGEVIGVEVWSDQEGAAVVSVGKGGISAEAEGDNQQAQGVYAVASDMSRITVDCQEGDISAAAGGEESSAYGIGVRATEDSGAAVMVNNVSAEAPNGFQVFGVSAGTSGDDPLLFIDVAGDVSVTGSQNDSMSTAVDVENEGGTIMLNVGGDIIANEARGVSIINHTETSGADSSLTQLGVGGDVVSQDSGYNVGVHMGTGSGDNKIEADYKGSIIVTGDAGNGVSMSGDGGTIEATVGKDIFVETEDTAAGVSTEYYGDMQESLTVQGSIEVHSANEDAFGIQAMGGGTGTETFAVSGDVDVSAPKGAAYGAVVDTTGAGSEMSISIEGNLSVSGVDDVGHCSSGATFYNGGSEIGLDVGGNISAVNGDGVEIMNQGEGDSTTVSVGGGISAANGDGVEIMNQGENAASTVSVDGYIEVDGAQPNAGVRISSTAEGAEAQVNAGGIYVCSAFHATGIEIDAGKGNAEVQTENEVVAVSQTGDAEAMDLYAGEDANVSVSAGGVVTAMTADEAGEAVGINVNPSIGAGKISVTALGGVSAENTGNGAATAIRVNHILPEDALKDESAVDIYVRGDVESTGNGIYIQTEEEGEGSVNVMVEGNVEADDTGVFLMGDQTMEVLVDGTVHGGESSVLVEGTVSDMTLTVWEIKPDDEGHYAERVDWLPDDPGPTTWEDEELCKEIQYIIRVQPNDHASLTAEGTTEYEGYQVAHEDDKVVLKIDVQPGYRLVGAYGDADQNIHLMKDDKGNWYLVVPRGGGVLLGVRLQKMVPAKKKLTVTFDPNGGTLRDSTEKFTVSAEKDEKLTLPEAPEKEGSVFLGWYGTSYSADDPRWTAPEAGSDELKPAGAQVTVTDNIFYTAVWQENAAE